MGAFERVEGFASTFAEHTSTGRNYLERLSELESTGLPTEKLDVVVVHGKNIGECWNPPDIRSQRFNLSPNSRINVLTAGIIHRMGLTEKILLSTGKTAGKHFPSEAEAMRRHLKRIFPTIPDEVILMEEDSLNTWENARNVKVMVDEAGFQKIGVISPGFHIPRVEYLFNKAGMQITGVPSENVLEATRPRLVENYRNSELYTREIRREMRALFIQQHAWGRVLDDLVVGIRRNPNDESLGSDENIDLAA